MPKSVLVIGGTRYFGKLLVRQLVDQGHAVTILTRGHSPDNFGLGVNRLRADRTDAVAMAQALGSREYDLVYDQMCYTPLDAIEIVGLLKNRVGRYVMASTIEVYRPLLKLLDRPFVEDDIDLSEEAIVLDLPWRPSPAEHHYGLGKRQAESIISKASFPWVTVRIGHVLSGVDDFTGRLASYVTGALAQLPLHHFRNPGKSSFIDCDGIVDFLLWIGSRAETGSFNAASDGMLSVDQLQLQIGEALGIPTVSIPDDSLAGSPFDYPAAYAMSTERAKQLGYRFNRMPDWLPGLVREHARAQTAA